MKMKLNLSIIVLLAVGFISYGFFGDNPVTKTNNGAVNVGPKYVQGPALESSVSSLNESFEGTTFPPAGWAKFSPLERIGWERYLVGDEIGFGNGFENSVIIECPGGGNAVSYVEYTYPAAQNVEWLVTPQITNVQPGDSLTFWLRYFPQQYPDSFLVKVSTTTQTVEAMTTTLEARRYSGPADSGWVKHKIRIGSSVPAGSNIYIGFLESFYDGASFSLDLVSYIPASAPPPSSWFEQTTPVTGTLASVSAPTDNAVWAAGYTSSTLGPPLVVRTTNGGTWTSALGTGIGAAVPLFNVWGIDANTALVTGSNATGAFVYRTTNGGTTWTTVFTQPSGFINVITMKDANTGFMEGDPVGGRWSLFKTTNGGTTWDSTGMYLPQAGSEAGWNNSIASVGDRIWFGTNNTKIYYSTNFGTNWTAQPTTGETGANGTVIGFNNATNGMMGGATLLTTTNSGTLWSPNAGTGTGNFTGITGLGSSWWTVRGTAIVGVSTNNGANWSTSYTTPAGSFAHITSSRSGSGLLYATKSNGQVAKYGTTTGVTPMNNVIVKDYSLSQNYPNPFNPTTNIKFAIPVSGFVTLKIYNMLGKEVAVLVNKSLNSGSYAYDFNASSLASGVYFYKLESNSFVETKRMVLVK